MRIGTGAVRRWTVIALALALTACGGAESEAPAAVQGGPAVEGLTPEQIQAEAEAMSPEEAESLGIVDSTIHVESLTSPGDTVLQQDTTRQ